MTPDQLFDAHTDLAYRIAGQWLRRTGQWRNREEFRQAALIGLWQASMRYRPGHAAAFSTFAYLCIRSALVGWIRKEDGVEGQSGQRLFERGMVRLIPAIDTVASPDTIDAPALVATLLATLPERSRAAVRGYYLEGARMRDIGQGLGRSESAVSRLVSAGLKSMREVGT